MQRYGASAQTILFRPNTSGGVATLGYDRRSWALAWTCALSFVPLVVLMRALARGRNGRKQAPAEREKGGKAE